MTNRTLIDNLIAAAAEIWEIDPIDMRSSRGLKAARARIAIAHFAYLHGCELDEILKGFERGWGSKDERKAFREPTVRLAHVQYLTTIDEYRERCLELMKAIGACQTER